MRPSTSWPAAFACWAQCGEGVALILFVGPLPPPVHGFSVINGAMLARFQAAGVVSVFNRAPPAGQGFIGQTWHGLRLLLAFLRSLWRSPAGSALYIGLSGGLGQLKDLPYLLAARLWRRPVLVHHHSFAYLRRQPWYARGVLGLLRQARHIALCDCMADVLAAKYRIPRQQVEVLSNAAHLPAAGPCATRVPQGALCLGFLSNITAAKGIWAFFELGDALLKRGVQVQAMVAGPVAPDIALRFAAELASRPWCQHLGAVYGADKDLFLGRIDVLVFPTFYANEAEPVTILEALSLGVPVVANARGCIQDVLPASAGAVFTDDPQFVGLAAQLLQDWAGQASSVWLDRRMAAHAAFNALQTEHARRAGQIVARMTGGVAP